MRARREVSSGRPAGPPDKISSADTLAVRGAHRRRRAARVGTVVTGISLEPYERTRDVARRIGSRPAQLALLCRHARGTLAARVGVFGRVPQRMTSSRPPSGGEGRDLDRRFGLGGAVTSSREARRDPRRAASRPKLAASLRRLAERRFSAGALLARAAHAARPAPRFESGSRRGASAQLSESHRASLEAHPRQRAAAHAHRRRARRRRAPTRRRPRPRESADVRGGAGRSGPRASAKRPRRQVARPARPLPRRARKADFAPPASLQPVLDNALPLRRACRHGLHRTRGRPDPLRGRGRQARRRRRRAGADLRAGRARRRRRRDARLGLSGCRSRAASPAALQGTSKRTAARARRPAARRLVAGRAAAELLLGLRSAARCSFSVFCGVPLSGAYLLWLLRTLHGHLLPCSGGRARGRTGHAGLADDDSVRACRSLTTVSGAGNWLTTRFRRLPGSVRLVHLQAEALARRRRLRLLAA